MRKLQAGDTIIEVMLAMSIIGIVLGAAFGIANRSVSVGQDAQERTEALKLAETQLELFKSQYAISSVVRDRNETQPFCFDVTAATPTMHDASDDQCDKVDATGTDGIYSIKILPPSRFGATGSYTIEIRWERLGATAVENAENSLILYYKPGKI
jgi:prepilin-type N-terminal cleavage/methylation domain-containing protein